MNLLYIYPRSRAAAEPVIDEATRKMTAAYLASKTTGILWRGFHVCKCGVRSSNTDYILPGGMITNSLCVHYLAFHRDEVPEEEVTKVMGLESGEAEPSEWHLADPEGERF